MMGWWNWGDGGWLGMGVGMLLWLVVIVVVVWLLLRVVTRTDASRPLVPRQTPEEILRERFARGEINEEEYRQRTELLKEK